MKRVLYMVVVGLSVLCPAGISPAQEPAAEVNEAEILSFLESRIPEAFDKLRATRASDPAGYQNQLRELGARIAYYQQVKKRWPEFAESLLRAQSIRFRGTALAEQLRRKEPGPDRDALVEELHGLLEEQFDLELLKPEMEVEFLGKEVDRLRKLVARQRASREAIVDLRLKDMTGEGTGSTR